MWFRTEPGMECLRNLPADHCKLQSCSTMPFLDERCLGPGRAWLSEAGFSVYGTAKPSFFPRPRSHLPTWS